MNKQEQIAAIKEYQAQTTGTDTYYRHPLSKIVYSSGVKFVADTAGAYWLIDAILSHQNERIIRSNQRLQDFQIWFLKHNKTGNGWKLTCWEDTGEDEKPVITQKISFSDFPMDEIKFYVENGVLYLPEER